MALEPIISAILDQEWAMFAKVRSAQPAACQQAPEAFRQIRGSIFATWGHTTLACYLEDLREATAQGRNILSEKYARMDGLLPELPPAPEVEEIVAIEERWQEQLASRYPGLSRRVSRRRLPTGDGSNFAVYLRCELMTYGTATRLSYLADLRQALHRGENLAVRSLALLVKASGYRDLEHAEACLAPRGKDNEPLEP